MRASDKPSSIFEVNFDFTSNYPTIAAHSLHLALLFSRLQSPSLFGPVCNNQSHKRRGNLIDLAFLPPHRSLTFVFAYIWLPKLSPQLHTLLFLIQRSPWGSANLRSLSF